ncbi:hypothetical protein L905_26530 [Agrobacterium sp. TS43]|nr:hypothetical protein L902_23180 [Agrobacterium radiobacter DSM 30147]KVK40310.1 hypothetical protein L903_14885 [Agrobacterium sp. JL28]KVK40860.1 hypothetical protein L904_14885 [Agrobacterium sp. LY4]KVK42130.1 hypothetical protein L901_09210 [Agrobacterium sp. D14]KVK57461.1 hypothetical protein L907_14795 [Agrobacterium sp. C13]KVK70974.1 hypothetical protein L905_26530 [Agrobacterium sp. TS43]
MIIIMKLVLESLIYGKLIFVPGNFIFVTFYFI